MRKIVNLALGVVTSLDFSDVAEVNRRIHLRLAIGETTVGAIEQRVRQLLLKVPGSR